MKSESIDSGRRRGTRTPTRQILPCPWARERTGIAANASSANAASRLFNHATFGTRRKGLALAVDPHWRLAPGAGDTRRSLVRQRATTRGHRATRRHIAGDRCGLAPEAGLDDESGTRQSPSDPPPSNGASRARSRCHPLANRPVARINSAVMPGLLAACPASFTTTSSERGHRRCSSHAPPSGA